MQQTANPAQKRELPSITSYNGHLRGQFTLGGIDELIATAAPEGKEEYQVSSKSPVTLEVKFVGLNAEGTGPQEFTGKLVQKDTHSVWEKHQVLPSQKLTYKELKRAMRGSEDGTVEIVVTNVTFGARFGLGTKQIGM